MNTDILHQFCNIRILYSYEYESIIQSIKILVNQDKTQSRLHSTPARAQPQNTPKDIQLSITTKLVTIVSLQSSQHCKAYICGAISFFIVITTFYSIYVHRITLRFCLVYIVFFHTLIQRQDSLLRTLHCSRRSLVFVLLFPDSFTNANTEGVQQLFRGYVVPVITCQRPMTSFNTK